MTKTLAADLANSHKSNLIKVNAKIAKNIKKSGWGELEKHHL